MAILFIILIPLLAASLSFAFPRERKKLIEISAFGAGIGELGAIAWLGVLMLSRDYVEFGVFAVDALGFLLLLIIGVVGFAAITYSIGYLREEIEKEVIGFRRMRQFFVLLHLFLFAMYLAVTTQNPIVMWTAIEATTLATTFLVSFYSKTSPMEAAFKYLILNSVGLLIGFLGTIIFLGAASQAGLRGGFMEWSQLLDAAPLLNAAAIKVAFILVLVGYGTKVGWAPMHTWLPDAHSNAPSPISALLSGVLLNVALLAVLRFKGVADAALGTSFSSELMIFFGIMSISISAMIILMQKHYKRLLAYSSIENMGLLALGFAFGGVGTIAALLHMVYHAVLKSLLFLAAGNILLKYGSGIIEDIRGALKVMPMTSILFIGGLLSIAGLPPFGIFFTKFQIIQAGMAGYPWLSIGVMAALVLVFTGFLRTLAHICFGQPRVEIRVGEDNLFTLLPIVFLVAVFIVLSFIVPAWFRDILSNAAGIIS